MKNRQFDTEVRPNSLFYTINKIIIMKKYLQALLIIAIFAACTKKLDLQPISTVGIDNTYKTGKDIDQAIAGAYDALQQPAQYGTNFPFFMEVSSDNSELENLTINAGILAQFERFTLTPDNTTLDATWVSLYDGIQRTNVLLNRLPGISMDATTKATRGGEAKFIRALSYFNLVRIWGDVPLVLTEVKDPFTAFNDTRQPQNVVYEQIVKDLQDAINALPLTYATVDLGRATKGAAQTLLAKVYLTRKQYAEAATVSKSIIISGTYKLQPNFSDIFSLVNENGSESIFEVQYKSGGLGEGSTFAADFIPQNSNYLIGSVGNALGNNEPTTDLYNLYDPTDKRKDMIGKLPDGRLYTKKYLETIKATADGDHNFIVLRYADVLLMNSEALNEQGYSPEGDAFTYLNQIRVRAGLLPYSSIDLPDQGSFRLAIEKERRLELAFENHRWFDLLRTGRAITVMNQYVPGTGKITLDAHNLLFPIPLIEINASAGKLTQNPGY